MLCPTHPGIEYNKKINRECGSRTLGTAVLTDGKTIGFGNPNPAMQRKQKNITVPVEDPGFLTSKNDRPWTLKVESGARSRLK